MPRLWTETIQEHRRAVHDAVVDAAAALVAENGLTSVTMSKVAERTGIGRATLYKYFPDVEAILIAWHQRQIAGHLAQLTEARDAAAGPGGQLEAVLAAYALHQRQRQHHGTELAALLHKGERVIRAQHQLHAFVADLVAQGASVGRIRDDIDPGELASYCLHALTAAGSLPSEAAVRRLVAVTMAGLRPAQARPLYQRNSASSEPSSPSPPCATASREQVMRRRGPLWRPARAAAFLAHGRMTAVDRSKRIGLRMPFRVGVMAGLLASAACSAGAGTATMGGQPEGGQAGAAAANPDLDPGTSLGALAAPGFRLVNQFGQPMSLRQFRGKVVILAFTDSECTTICPLTTASMAEAKDLLGAAGDQVQLLGIDANPAATKVADVMAYSQAHGLVNQWDFLTGSPAQLRAVWKAYGIYAQIQAGQVDHTAALYVIDQQSREQTVYLTTMAYASVGQEAQVLAQKAASLLPGHPRLASQQSLAYIGGLAPTTRAGLPAVPAGSVTVGPGRPHLLVFFTTWLTETSNLSAELTALSRYARAEQPDGLPQLIAVDEAATEPSPGAAQAYLQQLGRPLGYPVALDTSGRLADGYGVQDQPWYVLTSASGKIVWQHDGWLPVPAVMAAARRA